MSFRLLNNYANEYSLITTAVLMILTLLLIVSVGYEFYSGRLNECVSRAACCEGDTLLVYHQFVLCRNKRV